MDKPKHSLVCPDCHTPVVETDVELACPKGHGRWPVQNGVPWFVSESPKFEGRWQKTYPLTGSAGIFGRLVRRNAHWGIPHLVEPLIRGAAGAPVEILDLGCGGGWEFLGRCGNVTGVDLNSAALEAASQVYSGTIKACAWARLPFSDSSFDVVASFWLAEHLEDAEFIRLLHEAKRVLKPAGHFVFLADLHSSKPVLRWARSYPDLYRKFHVERVGHRGLRTLDYTRGLLRDAGYVEQKTIAINKSSLLQPVTALWMFGNALGRKSKLLHLYVLFCRLALRSAILHRAAYGVLMEYHRMLDRHLPDSYAFSAVFDWKFPAGNEDSRQPGHSSPRQKGRPDDEVGSAPIRR